ncbi:MAG: sel1 repeat family protein [Gammaproteobacteria bacterium]|nr:sel1 repeat family protein [Gammaproteobacteria bacterium]MDH3577712.1 sel1 repeat family protein [Gammaproteobacteria bacterium]
MRTFSHTFLAAIILLLSSFVWAGDVQKGWAAYNSTDYATALSEWQELADTGDTDACYGMGLLYGNGFGVDMNDDLALKYYGIAAAQGHAEAQYSLGVMYQNGWGVPMDEEEGIKWYLLAADQGIVGAHLALGRVYGMDYSEKYDPVSAHTWFTLAANFGDIDAKTKLELLESRMSPEQLAEAKGRSEVWMENHRNLKAGK